MIPQQPTRPKSMVMAVPMSLSRAESLPPGIMSATAAEILKRNTFTDSRAKGPAHSAHTATRQKTPAEFLMMEAAERTTDAASAMIPPTPGRDEEMTVLAVFTAVASVLPVISPVRPI